MTTQNTTYSLVLQYPIMTDRILLLWVAGKLNHTKHKTRHISVSGFYIPKIRHLLEIFNVRRYGSIKKRGGYPLTFSQ
ncbi:hypothetical protein VP193E371_P0078 [Vibrio phage 193E37-1]|nr:hypothetical protein VP193E371_P0078 [Vibrio phage 193E37-1]